MNAYEVPAIPMGVDYQPVMNWHRNQSLLHSRFNSANSFSDFAQPHQLPSLSFNELAQLSIGSLVGQKLGLEETLDFPLHSDLNWLKQHLAKKIKVGATGLLLFMPAKKVVLEGSRSLASYGIQNGAQLRLMLIQKKNWSEHGEPPTTVHLRNIPGNYMLMDLESFLGDWFNHIDAIYLPTNFGRTEYQRQANRIVSNHSASRHAVQATQFDEHFNDKSCKCYAFINFTSMDHAVRFMVAVEGWQLSPTKIATTNWAESQGAESVVNGSLRRLAYHHNLEGIDDEHKPHYYHNGKRFLA
jgi:hypothetical protein